MSTRLRRTVSCLAALICTGAFAAAAPTFTNPPTIQVQPSNVKVCEGDPATFTVVATGSGTLTYQWRRNGVNLSNGGNISGATTPTLTINPTLPASPGTYTVRVSNNWGNVTSANRTLSFDTTDTDGDGTVDCVDGCPNDPGKTSPGICGCGVSDADSDGDGAADCVDGCPNDPFKTSPGVCGCGVADADSDGDGTVNCNDGCPNDPNKTSPGICGCGVSDADSDGDGTANCNDGCPDDPNKTSPGICGCGASDADGDGDGVADCNDGCPKDPNKTSPGSCGCGIADVDGDLDGAFDCDDNCPSISNPGQGDADNDGLGDDCDNCPQAANQGQEDCDSDGTGDACSGEPDCNSNGVPDSCDIALGASADTNSDGVPDECSNPITPFCFGDGAPVSCPCGNDGAIGNGCASSAAPGGAHLSGSGNPVVSADTLTVVATDVRGGNPTLALFFSAGVGIPHAVNDGLICTTGSVCRLWVWKVFGQQGTVVTLTGPGSETVPDTTGISISQRSADKGRPITVNGETRVYTTWYRDPPNNGCPAPATSNYTNGLRIIWGL